MQCSVDVFLDKIYVEWMFVNYVNMCQLNNYSQTMTITWLIFEPVVSFIHNFELKNGYRHRKDVY